MLNQIFDGICARIGKGNMLNFLKEIKAHPELNGDDLMSALRWRVACKTANKKGRMGRPSKSQVYADEFIMASTLVRKALITTAKRNLSKESFEEFKRIIMEDLDVEDIKDYEI